MGHRFFFSRVIFFSFSFVSNGTFVPLWARGRRRERFFRRVMNATQNKGYVR